MRSFINELQFDTNPVVQKGEIAPGKAVVDSVIVQHSLGNLWNSSKIPAHMERLAIIRGTASRVGRGIRKALRTKA